MKAHTPFELPDVTFPVPLGMEKKLSQVLNRNYRVEVEWLADNGTKDKVNGLDLELPKKEGEHPEITAEELCQVVLAMGYMHAEQDEAEETRRYRVRQYWRDEKGKDRRAFFTYHVRPTGEETHPTPSGHPHDQMGMPSWGGIDDPYDHRASQQQMYMERTQRQMMDANGMVMRQVDMTLNTILRANSQVLEEQRKMNEENRIALRESRSQTSEAQDRLFKMAIALTAHNEQQEAIQNRALEMFSMGYQWFWWSVQQQMQASERRHRDELERARKEKKEENRWSFLSQIGPAVLMFGGGLLSRMGNEGLGDLLQDMGAEGAQAQQAAQAAAMGGFDPGGGAPGGFDPSGGAPSGFSPGPGAPAPGPGPGAPPPGFGAPPGAAPGGFAPPQAASSAGGYSAGVYQPPASPPGGFSPPPTAPAPDPAPEPPVNTFEHLSAVQKAQRFGELFSAAAWQTLRAGMTPDQVTALEQLITNEDPQHVGSLMVMFTRSLKAQPEGDAALSSVLTREQVQLATAIMQDVQAATAAAPSTPPVPGSPTATAPSPQQPVVPSPPPAPVPAGSDSLSAGPSSTGEGRSAPPDGGAGGRPVGGGDTAAFLSRVAKGWRVPEATVDELVESYPTLDELRAAPDDAILGMYGIGPVLLRKIRSELG